MSSSNGQSDSGQTVLVVDDEATVRDLLRYNLQREGFRVLTTGNGTEAIRLAYDELPDLIVLDVMLPGMSGLDVCRAVRRELTMPILMLSAREEEIDKVLGLELGADDYMTKPFGLRELLARVRAMLRRSHMPAPEQAKAQVPVSLSTGPLPTNTAPPPATGGAIVVDPDAPPRLVSGELVIDLAQHTVTIDGEQVTLKPKEFDLLAFLASHPMQVFTREVLLERVWGYDYPAGRRTVDVHVSGLRTKVEKDPSNPQLIQTVLSVGYKFGQPVKVLKPAQHTEP